MSQALFAWWRCEILTVISTICMPAADVDEEVVAKEVRQLLNKHTEMQKLCLEGPRSEGEHQIQQWATTGQWPPRDRTTTTSAPVVHHHSHLTAMFQVLVSLLMRPRSFVPPLRSIPTCGSLT